MSNTEQMVGGLWVACGPEWLRAGGDCTTAPRICCEAGQGISHLHPARHQGEPFAWLVESPKDLEYVEGVARTQEDANKYVAMGWSSTPMFRHADAGESERLQRRIQNADLALKAQTQNCDTLRAQLANWQALAAERLEMITRRDALLIKASYVIDHARAIDKQAFARGTQNVDHTMFRGLGNLLEQYDEARRSASAEPTAIKRETHAEMRIRHKRELDALDGGGFRYEECRCGTRGSYPVEVKHCVCGNLFGSAEPSAREAQALKDESRLGIERHPSEHSTTDDLEGVEDLALRIDARVKARAALERKP